MPNLKLALRTLTKTPFITAVAILSLALGIGANAAIFSIFDQLLLRSLPVPEPERLVNVSAPGPNPGSQSCNQAGDCSVVFSYPMFRDLEEAGGPLSGLAGHRIFGANLTHDNRTVNADGMFVSGSYFPVLGLQAAVGRLLQPADDQVPGEHPVVVLGHGYWLSELGGDPSVLNSTLLVNGQPMTIVGVAPEGFWGTTLGGRPRVFVPISMRGALERFDGFEERRTYWIYVFGRLRPGVSLEQAREELNTIYRPIVAEVEAPLQEGMSAQTMERFLAKEIVLEEGYRGQSSLHDETRTPLVLLLSITGMVLVIACANIANLLLARGAGRSQEMAIRGSLGASRRALLGQLLAESVLLAVVGGLASLVVARWTMGAILTLLPPDEIPIEVGLNGKVLLFTVALSLFTGFLFGLYPALHATRADLVAMLKGGGGQPAGARAAHRFRGALATSQIALSMALLVVAGLFIKSLGNLSRVDLGMRTDNLVTFGVYPGGNGYDAEESRQVFEGIERELAALPGVTAVSSATIAVIAGNSSGNDVSVQGFESGPDTDANARINEVGAGYFGTMGIPLLAGREFTEADDMEQPLVAVVNQAFARKFGLDEGEVIGARMAVGRSAELDIEIVGLVQDAKYNQVRGDPPAMYFRPWRQRERVWMTFYARTGMDPSAVMGQVQGLVRRVDPNLPVAQLMTLEQQIDENVAGDRVIGTLSAAFALLATLLAAVGLYGVLAYTVAQRTREIGLRMALGAGKDRVRRMVLAQVGRMTLIGGVIGLLGALALGRAARSLLFELQGHDPLVILVVVVIISLVAVGAGLVPAFKASRVDPMVALRCD